MNNGMNAIYISHCTIHTTLRRVHQSARRLFRRSSLQADLASIISKDAYQNNQNNHMLREGESWLSDMTNQRQNS